MWVIDIGIPARSTIEDTMAYRDQIIKQFGPALYSFTVFGFIEFRIRFTNKIDALKAKLGIKSFLQQKGYEVIDGEISTENAYIIAGPEKNLE